MGSELGWGLLADQSESRKFLCSNMERLCAALNRRQKYTCMCSASRKCTAQFQGFAIISRYKVTYWGPKMTRKSIESSSCSKEGCLQSIERLKAQPASLQWDLHVTSGDHFEAAKSTLLAEPFVSNEGSAEIVSTFN